MIRVIALGNRLMGDDAIALEVLDEIYPRLIALDIDTIWGETDPYVLYSIEEDDYLIVLDACITGKKIGHVSVWDLKTVNKKVIKSLSQHEVSLLDQLKICGNRIKGVLIGIEVKEIRVKLGISKELIEVIDYIQERVFNICAQFKENTDLLG